MNALGRLPNVVVGFLVGTAMIAAQDESALASPPPQTAPLRSLAVMAEAIVVVETESIVEDQGGFKCRVLKVVHGAGVATGEEIVVAKTGNLRWPSGPMDVTLLYLRFARRPPLPDNAKPLDPRIGFVAFEEGIVHRDRTGGVHRPSYDVWGRELSLQPIPNLTWDKLLADLKGDLREIAGLRTIQRIDHLPTRNHAFFGWMARHRDEMKGWIYFNYAQHDFGPLKYEILPSIMDSAIPADCWRAVELAAEFEHRFEPRGFAFCTREGRALLVEKALDSSLPEKTRLLALWWLDHRATHHYIRSPSDPPHPTARDIEPQEQTAYRAKLEPLLTHSDKNLRAAAAAAVKEIDFKFDPRQYSFAP